MTHIRMVKARRPAMSSHQPAIQDSEIRNLAAFRVLSEAQLRQIAPALIRQTYQPGQFIFLEGEPSGGLWFVVKGRVKISKQSLNGRVQGVCLVSRGKCFGSCPLFQMEQNPASAQAVDEVTLYILPRQHLHYLERQSPLFSLALLRIYSQRLDHLASLIESLGAWTATDRINYCLLTYADHTESAPVVRLSHEKLAALSGTVREVVTRHLSRLEKAGAVRVEPGQITLIDSGTLTLPCLLGNDKP